MRLVALIVFVAASLLGSSGFASAGQVEDRMAALRTIQGQAALLSAERRGLERKHQALTAEIARLKGQRASWNRDRKLEEQLRESQELAALLESRQREQAALDERVLVERQGLVASIDEELAGLPGDASARRAKLVLLRAWAAAEVDARTRKIRLPDDRIDPLDDPEDLDLKASMLAESEALLREEESRMERRALHFRQVTRLEKSRRRADELDLFYDEQPRRKSLQGSRGATPDEKGAPKISATSDERTKDTPPSDLAVDLSVVYADILDTSTLEALRRADRSGDSESRAKAAEDAKSDLRARADKLRRKRLEMEQRAKALRAPGK
ncbi:MAG: hypothetical protein HY698_04115 [Deltaproteobacteria bacterium]|nr:hypothetical protein [Deltaproteobacteria bacterium]